LSTAKPLEANKIRECRSTAARVIAGTM